MLKTLLFSCLSISLFLSASAQSCANHVFASNKVYSTCADLPVLNSSLHWTLYPSSQIVHIAYRHGEITPRRWVSWAINPTSEGMFGAQSLVAYQKSDGTMRFYTSPLSSSTSQLVEGDLSFPVSDLSATYENNEITIFATLYLQSINTSNSVNQVWQDGTLSADDTPRAHDTFGPNMQSSGSLNLLSGKSAPAAGGNSKAKKKNIHGVLNAISWGIMMPLGALIARYVKVFESADPAWFYLHVTCQTSAYIIGVAGWATGLQLGNQSPGVEHTAHRTIGIILFCLGTLQVFALLLRPKKDHKYRLYWNIYHHSVGYSVIILGIVNIFKGFDILHPDKEWEKSYIGIILVLALVAAAFEAYTWFLVVKGKRSAEKASNGMNGTNGINGHMTQVKV